MCPVPSTKLGINKDLLSEWIFTSHIMVKLRYCMQLILWDMKIILWDTSSSSLMSHLSNAYHCSVFGAKRGKSWQRYTIPYLSWGKNCPSGVEKNIIPISTRYVNDLTDTCLLCTKHYGRSLFTLRSSRSSKRDKTNLSIAIIWINK